MIISQYLNIVLFWSILNTYSSIFLPQVYVVNFLDLKELKIKKTQTKLWDP